MGNEQLDQQSGTYILGSRATGPQTRKFWHLKSVNEGRRPKAEGQDAQPEGIDYYRKFLATEFIVDD